MTTYRDMKAQIIKLEKQAADLFKKEVADAISKIKALMNDYGLSIADLGGRTKAGRTTSLKKASAAKYRDPVSGKTWTGHGKAPGWIVAAVKAGKSREDFLITKAKATATKVAPTVKSTAPKAKAKPAASKATPAKRTSPAPKVVAKPAPQKKVSAKASANKAPAKAASKAPTKAPAKTVTKKPAAKPAKATPAPKAVTPPATAA